MMRTSRTFLHFGRDRAKSTQSWLSKQNATEFRPVSVTFRFGSLCLWDLTEDIIFPHQPFSRAGTHANIMNASSPPAGINGNSITTLGNSVPLPMPGSNSLPHVVVSRAGSKSSVVDGPLPPRSANSQLSPGMTGRRRTKRKTQAKPQHGTHFKQEQ